jgi:ligand-binding sensor domain-containing protein/signal transduction histidine kinase/CheY-like chemotaxis protein/AraC-like DNA-binding protein
MIKNKKPYLFNIRKTLSAILVIIIYSISLTYNSQAQELKFRHISNENGLSNSTIECIFQDHLGFIWFGTRDGLNKYDGYQIKVFKHEPKKPESLSDNYIRCIYEDKHKNLWIGTSNGLNKFDAARQNFINYTFAKQSSKLHTNIITSVCEDANGNIWAGTYGDGLFLYNAQKNMFEAFKGKTKLSDPRINYMVNDQEGNLWIATDKGLNLFNPKTAVIHTIPEFKPYAIRVIAKRANQELWLGTEDKGLFCYNILTKKITSYRHQNTNPNSLGSDQVRAIVVDAKNNLWVGGINGGLDLLNVTTQQFTHYQNEPGNLYSLSQRTVSALYKDRQGNLWVGTHRGGVNLYSPQAEKFKLIQQKPDKNSLSYNDVRTFYEDKEGNLWVGTDGGGLNFWNRTTNSFTHYRNNPYNTSSIGSDALLHIMESSDGDLITGTWGGGLNILDRKTGTFKRYTTNTNNQQAISSDYIQKSFEDSRKNIWVGTYYGGLNLFDKKAGTFKRIVYGKDKRTQLSGNNVVAIEEDSEHNLWIGTDDGGLNCYNLTTGTFTHYFTKDIKKPDLRIIFIDSKGRLWIGQTGLYLLDKKTNTFSLFTTKAGLANEFIKGITEDKKGNLWISTSNGLTKLNPQTLDFKKYNTEDGLQGLEFEANAYLKSKSGEMFFGGINGFNYFYPEQIKTNNYIPPVFLTGFSIYNKEIFAGDKDSPLKKDISLTKEIKLSYDQSAIAFSFAALNYTAAENNRYAYKLEGFDHDWNDAGNNRKASYTNLDPGTYTFRVKAANNDGIWNHEGTAVKIIIAAPFWETWWFRISVFMIFVYLTYLLLNFKRKLEIRAIEEKKREEMHQIQLQFFTNISHEFRTPLSLILGPIDRLLKEDQDSSFKHFYTTIHRNANRLLSLLNELMDFRKVENGALKLKVSEGNINSFIDEVAEEFRDMAGEKNISFVVKKDKHLPEAWFDKQVLEKIVLNLINNALKYTPEGGKVILETLSDIDNIRFSFENELTIRSNYPAKKYVAIRVSDNGIGISGESIKHLFERYYRITESHLGSGVGLAFVKSLTMLHKGLIMVSSEKQEGTELIIALPADKSDYSTEEIWKEEEIQGGVRLESITYSPEKKKEIEVTGLPKNQSAIEGKHILIVDDNEELREFLKQTLSLNYIVSEASNGQEGIEKAAEVFPDLIISDVMMPGMNGIEFCRLLKENTETSHIPFLMLTAKNSTEAEIEGASSGADFYFAKPININLLQLTLKNIFEQKQKLKDHYLKDHHTQARELVHSIKDKEFMDKLLGIIDSQLINPDLDIDFLCIEIGMSRTKLYQKIKTITGQSIGEFIRTIRLRKAVEIMTKEDVMLTEVMYRVGIQTQSYFTKAFKKEFGKTPTQFLQELSKR